MDLCCYRSVQLSRWGTGIFGPHRYCTGSRAGSSGVPGDILLGVPGTVLSPGSEGCAVGMLLLSAPAGWCGVGGTALAADG
jgi:hypothetical protein